MSLFGPPNVAKLKEKGKTKDLIKVLNHKKYSISVKMQAVQALSELFCVESVEPICRLLNELSGLNIDLSITCAIALGNLGDSSAIEPLIDALKRTKYESNLEQLLELKRKMALNKNGFDYELAGKLAKDWVSSRYNYMQSVRMLAAQALGKIGNKKAIPALRDTVQDTNPIVARYASDALARIGQDSFKELINLLKDTDFNVKRLAARALSQINTPEAKELLKSISSDKDEIIQNYVKCPSSSAGWKPPQIEIVNELIELLDFYTDINVHFMIDELTPNKEIDQKAISEAAVKDSVNIITQKYNLTDQKEVDDILQMACEKKDQGKK